MKKEIHVCMYADVLVFNLLLLMIDYCIVLYAVCVCCILITILMRFCCTITSLRCTPVRYSD
jgi:hypothetical protein